MSIGQVLESGNMREMIRERDEALAELDRGGRPGVTVCVPCFNQVEYLEEALESVEQQTVAPLETIVVDDGSNGEGEEFGIAQLCDVYSARHVRVTNRGLPNARNTGLMLARGEWFLPLDADDWLDPCYIEKTLDQAAATPAADVVLTGIQEHGEHRNGQYMPGFDRPWTEVTVELLLADFNRFFYCSLFRTRLLREIGGYNGRMLIGFEDYDAWIDLMKRGVTFTAVHEPLFNYRTRSDSMLSDAMARRDEIMAEIHRHHAA